MSANKRTRRLARRWAAPVLILALFLTALPLWAQYNVQVARGELGTSMTSITEFYKAQIPSEAYATVTVDGKPTRVLNPEHPGFKEVQARWKQSMTRAQTQYNQADGVRWKEFKQIVEEAGFGGKVQNTGSVPKRVGSDIDLTCSNDHVAGELAETLRGKGHKVIELSDRFVDTTSDCTIWKDAAKTKIGTQEWIDLVKEGAVLHSDKFSTAGGKYFTSGGEIGVRDPAGAVIDNLKKFSDSGATGTSKNVDWHTAGKSVAKSAEIAGIKLDPKFQQQIESLRGHQNIEQALDLFGKTPQQQAEAIAEFQRKLVDTGAEAMTTAQERSLNLDAKRARVAEKARARGKVQLADKIEAQLKEAKLSRQITQEAVSQRDPLLKETFDAASKTAQQKIEAKGQTNTEIAESSVPEVEAGAAPIPETPTKFAQAVGAYRKWGGRALMGLWIVNSGLTAADKEMEDAILEGREPSKLRAVGHAILEGTLIAPTIHSWNTGTALRDARLDEYDQKYGDHWGIEARAVAMWDGVKTISCYNLGVQMGQEELDAEMRRALAAGEDMSRYEFMKNATTRVLGEITMISSICRSITRDWKAEARWHESERRLRNYVVARTEAALKDLAGLDRGIRWLEAHRPGDPRIAQMKELRKSRLDQIHGLAKRMRIRLGAQDPLTIAMYKELKRQKGGVDAAVMLRQILKSWYCTNRPKIEVTLMIQEMVRRGMLPGMTPKEYQRVVEKMAEHWTAAGRPGERVTRATQTAVDAIGTMTPDRVPSECRWPGQPAAPASHGDPQAVAKWRSGMASSFQASVLRAMVSRNPQAASKQLASLEKALSFSSEARAEMGRARREVEAPRAVKGD